MTVFCVGNLLLNGPFSIRTFKADNDFDKHAFWAEEKKGFKNKINKQGIRLTTTIDRISLANPLKHMNDKKTNTLTPLCKNKSLDFRFFMLYWF